MALITLAEAKEYLRVDTDADDALIGSLLLSAGRLCADVARLNDEECAQCPLNQFGSGENGGKACKNKRRIFILREGELIPILLTLPTGSMKEFAVYVKRLLAKGKKSSSVVTRFSLQKVQNSGGIAYSQAKFAVDRVLTDEEQRYISAMAEQVKAFASRVAYDDAPGEVIDPETGEVVQPLN